MQIFNDFVKPRVQDELEQLFLGNSFPYFYANESVTPCENEIDDKTAGATLSDNNSIEAPQFSHLFVCDGAVNSAAYKEIAPIANKLLDCVDGDYFMYRCKVNMNLIDSRFQDKYHTPHIDNGFDNQITAIYYVNDSDGDTFFFGKDGEITKRVTPKKGTLVLWEGKVFHAKASPVKSLSRVVINFNLLPYSK